MRPSVNRNNLVLRDIIDNGRIASLELIRRTSVTIFGVVLVKHLDKQENVSVFSIRWNHAEAAF